MVVITMLMTISCTSGKKMTKAEPPSMANELQESVLLGNENLMQNHLDVVKEKRIGLLTNPSGVNSNLQSSADLFYLHKGIQLKALFAPEHGIRGAEYAGDNIKDQIDPHTNLPVYSLYGDHRKPTAEMIEGLDAIIVDIQDIGVRGYTYIYTMAKVMEAAAEFDKEVIVLDRPNPIGGIRVEGNLVEEPFYSFVGLYPIPYRHGMTIGELAKLFNKEFGIECHLTVIPMKFWKREMLWGDTGLQWVPTSPHVPHWETVLFMSATGTFGELRTLSEGVGYTSPFEIVGAPWIKAREFADALNDLHLPGVIFRPLTFHPYYASYEGQVCQGVQLHLTKPRQFDSYITGLHIMKTAMHLYPEHDLFANKHRLGMFNKVMGTDKIMKKLIRGMSVEDIAEDWQNELNRFNEVRKQYLIY
ncbi:MAG: DUF1343 domain-containing protein [Caldithrix sp.]|nr:DUF1343 domain-containing protein [Caldithrix sp.]